MAVTTVATAQLHRMAHLALAGTVVATAVAHHVVAVVAETVSRGNPFETDAMAGAFDQLSSGDAPEYLNYRL